MGLMGTLMKVAAGYVAAKGVEKLSSGEGLNGLLGGLTGGAQVDASNPMAQMQSQMAQMLGGEGNPMAGMMGMLQNGGLGALMGAAGGGAVAGAAGLGGLLDSFTPQDTTPELEESAGLMLRAMIQAAKCDGGIDDTEKAKLLEAVGEDADPADMAFVQSQLDAPVDAEALAQDTSEAQRLQVYSASLMAITVDTPAEAQYLDALAKAMTLDEAVVNGLHMQMGRQPLYS